MPKHHPHHHNTFCIKLPSSPHKHDWKVLLSAIYCCSIASSSSLQWFLFFLVPFNIHEILRTRDPVKFANNSLFSRSISPFAKDMWYGNGNGDDDGDGEKKLSWVLMWTSFLLFYTMSLYIVLNVIFRWCVSSVWMRVIRSNDSAISIPHHPMCEVE